MIYERIYNNNNKKTVKVEKFSLRFFFFFWVLMMGKICTSKWKGLFHSAFREKEKKSELVNAFKSGTV